MIRYITRHGQVGTSSAFAEGNYKEICLSDLGRKQAKLLGQRLAQMGFHGRILASPYMRTLETASIIAEETGSLITPFAPVREIVKTEKQGQRYVGLTIEEIRALYAHIDPAAELPYPWWTKETEEAEDVEARVRAGVEEIEARYPDEPLLLVGHGASVGALHRVYKIRSRRGRMAFNCMLSSVDPADANVPTMYCDTEHIPYEETTSNYVTRAQHDTERMMAPWTEEIELPEWLAECRGPKILHIGDTESLLYPYYIKLIEEVKPDIILHTGDMADEVKVGRIPGTECEYLTKIMVLLDAMQRSGARMIIVPGNNDLPREIAHQISKISRSN